MKRSKEQNKIGKERRTDIDGGSPVGKGHIQERCSQPLTTAEADDFWMPPVCKRKQTILQLETPCSTQLSNTPINMFTQRF